jgi:hypothetical protein
MDWEEGLSLRSSQKVDGENGLGRGFKVVVESTRLRARGCEIEGQEM